MQGRSAKVQGKKTNKAQRNNIARIERKWMDSRMQRKQATKKYTEKPEKSMEAVLYPSTFADLLFSWGIEFYGCRR